MKTKIIKITVLSMILLFACKRDELDFSKGQNISANPEMAIPVFKTRLTLGDYINEDSHETVQLNSDNSLSIVFKKDSLMEVVAGELITLDDQNFYNDAFTIGSFTVGPFSTTGAVTLGDILDNLSPSEVGDSIRARNGTVDYFPEISPQSVGGYAEQNFEGFKVAYITEGQMDLLIINGFQVDLDNLVLSIRNKEDSSLVTGVTIANLPATSNTTRTVDLAGARMGNELFVEFENFSSPGSGPDPFDSSKHVLISTNDQLVFKMDVNEMTVDSGEVVIPDQLAEAINDTVDFATANGEEIDIFELKEGVLTYDINSSFQSDIQLTFNLPTATKNGNTFAEIVNVPAGMNSSGTMDLSGYSIAFNEIPSQTFNKLPMEVNVSVISGGGFIKFRSTDEISMNIGMENVEYEYMQGYFGQSDIQIDPFTTTADFAFIEELEGDFRFFNPYFRMTVSNAVGLPTDLDLSVTGYNTSNNNTEILGAPKLGVPFPSFAQRGETVVDTLEINNTNSNIVDFMSIVPDSMVGSGVVSLNPNGSSVDRNFIYNDSKIRFGIEVEVPLEVAVDDLVLKDTEGAAVSLDLGDQIDIDSIQMNFNIINGFPLSADLELALVDSLGNALDTIFVNALEGAPVDAEGRVINAIIHSTQVKLDGEKMDNFFRTERIMVKAIVNTTGSDIPTKVKLFTDYFIELQLAVKARVSVKL